MFFFRKLKSKRGMVPLIVVAGIVAVTAIVSGTCLVSKYMDLSFSKPSAVVNTGKIPTLQSIEKSSDISDKLLQNVKKYSEDKAMKDFLELRSSVASSMVSCSVQCDGAVRDFRVRVLGPDKIYGYNVFPTQINIYGILPTTAHPNDKIHVTKVITYVMSNDTKFYIRKWEGDITLKNSDYTWNFMLKTPDLLYSKINGSKSDLDEMLNSRPNEYVVVFDVEGYREVWTYKYGPDGKVIGSEHVQDIPLSLHVKTLTAFYHQNDGMYELGGFKGSLPIRFADERELVAYAIRANGALSNIIARVWADNVHVIDSSADYKIYSIGVSENLKPIGGQIVDDADITVFEGNYTVYKMSNKLGDLFSIDRPWEIPIKYKSNYHDTAAFSTYITIFAVCKGKDSAGEFRYPIWLVIKPLISVENNIEIALDDTRMTKITDLLKDGGLSENDLQTLHDIVEEAKNSINNKLNYVKNVNYNDEKAKEYVEKAMGYYEKAIDCLNDAENSNDAEEVARLVKLAEIYEQMGDYYTGAADKAEHSNYEEAEHDVEKAEELKDLADEYEGNIFFVSGGGIFDKILQLTANPAIFVSIVIIGIIILGVIILKILKIIRI
jgi:hypothetical protein